MESISICTAITIALPSSLKSSHDDLNHRHSCPLFPFWN
jgi:hypothetical protein